MEDVKSSPSMSDTITSIMVDHSDTSKLDIISIEEPLICPRTLTGTANVQNKGALDWGFHGLLAFGANCSIFVIDTKNVQIVQTLDKHKSTVKKLLWDKTNTVQLVSGDASGQIIHWDIKSGMVLSVLQDGNKPVLDMHWMPGDYILAALHSPYFLIIWDIKRQTKLWKKSFTDTLLSFDVDPFDNSKIAFLCPDCILFLDNFTTRKIPSSNGRKFYVSSPRLDSTSEENLKGRDRLKRLMKGLVVGETKPKPDEAMTITECLQLQYHKSLRHHLILLYPRDVILVDLHINQTIGIIPFERTMSPLVQVYSSRQRDVLYCLHESGSVSVKVRRKHNLAVTPSPLDPNMDISTTDFGSYSSEMFVCYEHKCQSEIIRQMKSSKVLGVSVDPIRENRLGLFLSSGKIVFLELETANNMTPSRSLSDIVTPSSTERDNLRILTSAIHPTLNGNITVMKMCPPFTTKTQNQAASIIPVTCAVGTTSGYLYVFNLSDGTLNKEFALHTYPVRGLEWAGSRNILTYAFGEGSKVKNEIFVTDIRTGQSTSLRTDRSTESPIQILKVSPLRQFFVITMKDGPFELWDLRTLSLLRTMAKKFPHVMALEWSPLHGVKVASKAPRRKQSDSSDGSRSESGFSTLVREHLVFSDYEGHIFHFSVDEDCLKDGIKIPPEAGVSAVNSIAFKSNKIVKADSDGYLSMWDLKAKMAKNTYTNRGSLRYIRFAPGKTNLKLVILYSDGLELLLLKDDFEKLASLKWSRDFSKIVDVDWANKDNVVIATEDGWVRILDTKLTKFSSPLEQYKFRDIVYCPNIMPFEITYRMLFILCTQYWKPVPNYDYVTVQDGIPEEFVAQANDQLKLMNLGEDFGSLPITQKCLRVSKLIGDLSIIDVWTVANYYLRVYSEEQSKHQEVGNKTSSSCSDLKRIYKYPHIEPLDTCYDYLIDPFSYQRLQLDRVSLHEWKRGDYQHTQRVVEKLILLGEMDRAVQLLLETDIDNPNYYGDAIKACLIATIQQTGAAQSTVKLVATNLIANGKVWEGVQLLCLIGKGLDGCRYLMSYGMWESAIWLAKAILPQNEAQEVMKKFAEHLINTGCMVEALLVYISQYQFEKALEILHSNHSTYTAVLLLMACQSHKVNISQNLTNSIYSSFTEFLHSIGSHEAANGLAAQLNISG
uniref:WD repeat-containing protein 11 n=1 Tax=Lygus hesperus TaxID=30085 RepID=A0A146LNG3_LYGHE